MFNNRSEGLLFSKHAIFNVIETQKQQVIRAAEAVPEKRLRTEAIDTLVEELAKAFIIDVPQLVEAEITVSPPREVEVPLGRHQRFDYGDSVRSLKGTSVTFRVPFTGDREMFAVRPSSFSINPSRADVGSGALEVVFAGVSLEQAAIKAEFEEFLKTTKGNLATLSNNVAEFNSSLKQLASQYLHARKERLRKGDDLVGGLGYKVQS